MWTANDQDVVMVLFISLVNMSIFDAYCCYKLFAIGFSEYWLMNIQCVSKETSRTFLTVTLNQLTDVDNFWYEYFQQNMQSKTI